MHLKKKHAADPAEESQKWSHSQCFLIFNIEMSYHSTICNMNIDYIDPENYQSLVETHLPTLMTARVDVNLLEGTLWYCSST